MQFLHHISFKHWTEVEIMAILVVAIYVATFLPFFITHGMGKY